MDVQLCPQCLMEVMWEEGTVACPQCQERFEVFICTECGFAENEDEAHERSQPTWKKLK